MFYKRPSFRMGSKPTGIETLSPRVGAKEGIFDFIKGPYQRQIDVMHPELGFVLCELNVGLKQSIFCHANSFERFNLDNSRILENLTN